MDVAEDDDAAEQQQGSAAEEVDAAEEDDAAEQQQGSAAEEAGAGRSRLHQAAVARILAALGAGRTLSAAALRPHSTEWLRGSEAVVADVKRSLRKLVNFPEAGAVGQQDVAVLEAVLAGLPVGSAGRATVEVALAEARAFGEDFTAPQCALMLSDHNRQWCEGMSRLLAADAGFRPYLDLLLRAMQLSLENRRLVRSAAALPALEHVEVQRTQLSAPGPASRPPAPSKLAEKKMVQLWAWVVDILTAQGEPHAQLCPCVLLHLASYVHHSPPPPQLPYPSIPCQCALAGLGAHVCPYTDVTVCTVDDGSRFCAATQRLIDAGRAKVR